MSLSSAYPLVVRPFSRVREDSQEVRALSERLHARADLVVARSRALRAALIARELWNAATIDHPVFSEIP